MEVLHGLARANARGLAVKTQPGAQVSAGGVRYLRGAFAQGRTVLTHKRVVTLPTGVGAVWTCQWGLTLPTGVGAVWTCRRGVTLPAGVCLSVPILESMTSIPQRRAVERAPLSRSGKAFGLQQQNI